MRTRGSRNRSGRVIPVAVLVALLVGLGLWQLLSASTPERLTLPAGAEPATVERVVDGDTLVVTHDDRRLRVRLLNIDTPETHHPHRPVECLGPEAAAFLTDLLPPGSRVSLAFDRERTDRFGRTLAGVFAEDGTLVNARIAEAGLGRPILVGGNDRFLTEVTDAVARARTAGVGAFSATLSCTPASEFTEIPRR